MAEEKNSKKKTAKKPAAMKKTARKASSPKAAKKPKAADAADVLASEKEIGDVDGLVSIDKAEGADISDVPAPVAAEPSAPDEVEQALKAAAASDMAKETAKETEQAKQTEYQKNIFEPLPKSSFPEAGGCEKEVEDKRIGFEQGMKKSRRNSTIVMGVLVVGLIGGFALNSVLPDDFKWIIYVIFGLLVVFVVISLIMSSRTRKKLYANVDDYVKDIIVLVDSYVFDDPEFSQAEVSRIGHIDLSSVIEAHYFDTINAVNSRNIVRAYFLGREMTVSEIAARVPYQAPADGADHANDNPRKKPTESYGIFGKYITYPMALKDNASLILLMKGTNAYLPTFLDGYKEITVPILNSNFLVWATDESVADEFFAKKEISDIVNSFVSDKNLENMFLSINPHGLKICLNYNESVMEVPMEKGIVGQPYVHYKSDIGKVKGIIRALS